MSSQTAQYFIKARGLDRCTFWVERDTARTDLSMTVRDLMSDVDDPVEVWCAEDGRFFDATDDLAQKVADFAAKQGCQLSQSVLNWISNHVGLRYAYALGLEAA